MKIKNDQSGIAHVAMVVLIVVVIGVVGFVGWKVWDNKDKKLNNTTTSNSSNTKTSNPTKEDKLENTKIIDPYAGWKTYDGEKLKFTFRYPEEWNAVTSPNYNLVEIKDSSGSNIGYVDSYTTTYKDPESFWKNESFGQTTLSSELIDSNTSKVNGISMFYVHTLRNSDKGKNDGDTFVLLYEGKVAQFDFKHPYNETQKQIVNSIKFK